jgi:cupin 2 domain-containing protein
MNNIFLTPSHIPEELIETIYSNDSNQSIRIERIVSAGQSSPEGFWYDQAEDEWVLLAAGEARLAFDDGSADISLKAGDHIMIPAHRRHRVEYTSAAPPCVWICVFIKNI